MKRRKRMMVMVNSTTRMQGMERFLCRTILVLFCLTGSANLCASTYTLFKNGKSLYHIVVKEDASETEKLAANELQQYLQKISGATLPIRNTYNAETGCQILVGIMPEDATASSNEEAFTYVSRKSNIYIYGGEKRGTMYGVFSFLENELGIRWYTPSVTRIPTLTSWGFDELNHSETPTIRYRQNDFYCSTRDMAWYAHNKMNMSSILGSTAYGGVEKYWSCHTIPHFVPYSLFDTHPEYFCLRNGARKNNGQFCLSNPEVLKLCEEGMLKQMRQDPSYTIYSLSQADNQDYCECEDCKALEKEYGGHSGLIVWFVNQVADYVRSEFPDKYIGTFAYLYTRAAPTTNNIRPRSNVVIRLCSIECCFSHPFNSSLCSTNKSFITDLKNWSMVAQHLFIWDYIVDYAQYMAPWPNFHVLAPNLQRLRAYHAIGIYEESDYEANGASWDEMKAWVLSHLMWNPDQTETALVEDFINGYYGQAAPQIQAYYDLCQSLVKWDIHFGIYIDANNSLYTNDFINQADSILTEAKNAAESTEIRKRVERVTLQILYMKVSRDLYKSMHDGTWTEFVRLARLYNAKVKEWQSLDTFIAEKEEEYKEMLTSGITEPGEAETPADIYTLAGTPVKRQTTVSEARTTLPHGLYIIGGKKVIIH